MVWVRSPVYFYNRNGTYYFSRAVPSDLRHRFPKRKIEVSLRTKSESKAARSAIEGFRNWHQIPFLNGLPDRGSKVAEITYHFFGDNDYAAVTGWPNMIQTISHDGWLGIPPLGKEITMRSLDFWRVENSLIRENWVMVDLLHMYDQIGIDVFARLREFNKRRVIGN